MKAYERLIKYAKIYTTSDPASETVPSSKMGVGGKVQRCLKFLL